VSGGAGLVRLVLIEIRGRLGLQVFPAGTRWLVGTDGLTAGGPFVRSFDRSSVPLAKAQAGRQRRCDTHTHTDMQGARQTAYHTVTSTTVAGWLAGATKRQTPQAHHKHSHTASLARSHLVSYRLTWGLVLIKFT